MVIQIKSENKTGNAHSYAVSIVPRPLGQYINMDVLNLNSIAYRCRMRINGSERKPRIDYFLPENVLTIKCEDFLCSVSVNRHKK